MNNIDFRLNAGLLQKLEDPKLPDKRNRKPF